jgi:CheY-like chemotaxis protein
MHVLLIEDNEDDAELIQQALCERSTEAVTLNWADRLQTGIQKLTECPVDAVLVDLSLPDSQGLETLDRVRAQAHDAPVIVLTGLDNDVVAEKSLLHGAQDYLVKGRLTGGRAPTRHPLCHGPAPRRTSVAEERGALSSHLPRHPRRHLGLGDHFRRDVVQRGAPIGLWSGP